MHCKIILLILFFYSSHILASSVTIPNTFTNGTTASALEVNSNFDVLEGAVNDNDLRINTNTININTNSSDIQLNTSNINNNSSDIAEIQNDNDLRINTNTININTNSSDIQLNTSNISNNSSDIAEIQKNNGAGVLINGIRKGMFLGFNGNIQNPIEIYNLSSKGYIVPVLPNGGIANGTDIYYFATNDCSGQVYTRTTDITIGEFLVRHGIIFASNFSFISEHRYIKANALKEAPDILSAINWGNGNCVAQTPNGILMYKYDLLDADETGVSSADFDGVVTIGN